MFFDFGFHLGIKGNSRGDIMAICALFEQAFGKVRLPGGDTAQDQKNLSNLRLLQILSDPVWDTARNIYEARFNSNA